MIWLRYSGRLSYNLVCLEIYLLHQQLSQSNISNLILVPPYLS